MNSNVIENNTIFPDVSEPGVVVIADLPDKRAVRVAIARRGFILRRDQDAVDVWPGVCPHEGAELDVEHLGDKLVVCPWHGLKYGGRRLVEGRAIELCGARLELGDGHISIKPPVSDART
jgi:nitrite reductase/ring-hydroxylating ferredoxin subunit